MAVVLFAVLCAATGRPACAAGNAVTGARHWTFSIYFENDLFAGTDRNYTNGVKASWVSPDLTAYRDSPSLPAWSHRFIDLLPFINAPGLQRNLVLAIGQNIYTPADLQRANPDPNDRPYAGWLYGSVAFHSRNARWMDTIEVQGGIVGPWSLAQLAQNGVHSLRGIPTAKGWGYQLHNEPGVNLIWERKWRTFALGRESGFGVDLISHVGMSLGNVSTYANAGGEMRIGWNLPDDFGTSLIRPAGVTDSPLEVYTEGWSIHAFLYADGRAVGHDIFLDGNTFGSSRSVAKRNLVADLAAGIALVYGRFKLSLSRAVRTDEFTTQHGKQQFGSITLSYTY